MSYESPDQWVSADRLAKLEAIEAAEREREEADRRRAARRAMSPIAADESPRQALARVAKAIGEDGSREDVMAASFATLIAAARAGDERVIVRERTEDER